jgi:hypothetical protein
VRIMLVRRANATMGPYLYLPQVALVLHTTCKYTLAMSSSFRHCSTLHIEGCCACPKHTVWVRLGAIIPAFTRRYRTRLNLPTVDEFALRRFVLPSQRSLSSESKARLYSGHKLGFHPDMCSYILAAVARLMHGLHWYLLEVFVLIWRRLRHQHHKTSVSATIQ